MVLDVAYKPSEKIKPIYAGGTLTAPKFMPSLYEWLSSKGLQVIKHGNTTGTLTLYTVPVGFTLFVSSVWLSQVGTAGGNLRYGKLEVPSDIELISTNIKLESSNSTQALSYKIPVKIQENKIIRLLTPSSDTNLRAGFTGFIVKNDDIPYF